jgi:hypothetical protein
MPWQPSRPPRPSWQLHAAHELVGRSSSILPNPSIFLAGLWLQPPAAAFVDFGSAYTSNVFVESLQSDFAAARHSAHIRLGPADFGCPRQLEKNGRH